MENADRTTTTPADKFAAYGRIAWLWASSDLHRDWTTRLQARFVLPALEHGQYRILERGGMPVAYCAWAWLSTEAEARYVLEPGRLDPADWRSGDRLWFIDWVAPFGRDHTIELRRIMARQFPDSLARGYRVKPGGTKARVAHFAGEALDGAAVRRLRRRYHAELFAQLSADPGRNRQFRLNAGG